MVSTNNDSASKSSENLSMHSDPEAPFNGLGVMGTAHAARWGGAFLGSAVGLLTLLQMTSNVFGWDPHVFAAGVIAMIAAIPALIARITIRQLSAKSASVQGLFFSALALPVVVFTVVMLLPGTSLLSAEDSGPSAGSPEVQGEGSTADNDTSGEGLAKADSEQQIVRLQVAPFSVLTEDESDEEFMGRALQEVLARDLNQHPRLDAHSWTLARAMRDESIETFSEMTLPFITEQIKYGRFDYLITGELRSAGNKEGPEVRVFLWSVDPLGKKLETVFSFVENELFFSNISSVSGEVLKVLSANNPSILEEFSQFPISSFFTNKPDAYYLYAKAEYARLYEQNPATAETLLQQALELDSRFATAWGRLADSYIASGNQELAEEPALMALRFSDRLEPEEAWWLKVYKASEIDRDYERTKKVYEQFIAQFPKFVEVREGFIDFLSATGEYDLAIDVARQLIGLLGDSNPSGHHTMGHLAHSAGMLELSLRSFQRVAELQPNEIKSWSDLAMIQQVMGLEDESAESLARQEALGTAELGYVLRSVNQSSCQGGFGEAENLLAEAERQALSLEDKLEVAVTRQGYLVSRGRILDAISECSVINEFQQKIFRYADARRQRAELEADMCRYNLYAETDDLAKIDWDRVELARSLLNSEDRLGTRLQEFIFAVELSMQGIDLPGGARSLDESFDDVFQFLSSDAGFDTHHKYWLQADYLMGVGQYSDAETALLELLEKNPGDTDHFLSLARIANLQGEGEKALNYLSSEGEFCPFGATQLTQRLTSLISVGEITDARRVAVQAQQKYSEADSDYKAKIQIDVLSNKLKELDED